MALSGMVLCAGLGTRLRPLTQVLPKPACPVLNQPLVAFNLTLLRGLGLSRVVINTHHLPAEMRAAAATAAAGLGMKLEVSHEPTLLGTGGGLHAARALLGDNTVVLLNGDFLFDVDLARALDAHRQSGAAATLVVQPMPAGTAYRPLHAFPDGALACLPGETPPVGAEPWHFTGVHFLETAIFAGLSPSPSGIFETGYRQLRASGAQVRVHLDRGLWRDIGAPAEYLAANLELAFGGFPRARFAGLPLGAPVAPLAQVAGRVVDSVVGPRARVPSDADVERSVILEGTALRPGERLRRSIAAGELRIPCSPADIALLS